MRTILFSNIIIYCLQVHTTRINLILFIAPLFTGVLSEVRMDQEASPTTRRRRHSSSPPPRRRHERRFSSPPASPVSSLEYDAMFDQSAELIVDLTSPAIRRPLRDFNREEIQSGGGARNYLQSFFSSNQTFTETDLLEVNDVPDLNTIFIICLYTFALFIIDVLSIFFQTMLK